MNDKRLCSAVSPGDSLPQIRRKHPGVVVELPGLRFAVRAAHHTRLAEVRLEEAQFRPVKVRAFAARSRRPPVDCHTEEFPPEVLWKKVMLMKGLLYWLSPR